MIAVYARGVAAARQRQVPRRLLAACVAVLIGALLLALGAWPASTADASLLPAHDLLAPFRWGPGAVEPA